MTLRNILDFILDFNLLWIIAAVAGIWALVAGLELLTKIYEALPEDIKKLLIRFWNLPYLMKWAVLLLLFFAFAVLADFVNFLADYLRKITN